METRISLFGDLGYIETGKLEILQEGIGLEPFPSTNLEENRKT